MKQNKLWILVILTLVLSSFAFASVPVDNITGYYKLDETSGTNAFDSTSNGNNGTANNARVFTSNTGTSGQINSGADFTQGNDKITLANNIVSPASSFTINIWANRQDTGSNNNPIFEWSTSDSDRNMLYWNPDKTVQAYNVKSNTYNNVLSGVLNTSQWYMFTYVADGSTLRFYIDGVEIGTTTYGTHSSLSAFRIGTRASENQWFNGFMDEVLFADRAYTASEIKALYNLQKGGHESGQYPFVDTGLGLVRFDTSSISTGSDTDYYVWYGNASATEPGSTGTYESSLVAYWALDEKTGTTAIERIGGQNGTANDTRVFTSEQSLVLGTAADFTQGNDRIPTTYTSGFGATDTFSFKSWIKIPTGKNNKRHIILGNFVSAQAAQIEILADNKLRAYYGGSSSGVRDYRSVPSISVDEKKLVVATYVNQVIKIYIDNEEVSVTKNVDTPISGNMSPGTYTIGDDNRSTSKIYSDMIIDEVEVLSSELTLVQIQTIYNNESDNDTFWTFGPQEEAVSFTITTLPASNITFNSAQLNGEVANYD